jgi:uncharacterized protein
MTISLYQASVPAILQMLGSLAITLKKTEAHTAENKIDAATILNDRLIDDMLPMIKQVQIACDHAKGAVARISGKDNPKFEDSEQTIADLQARIAKTSEFVNSFKASDIDGREDETVTLKLQTEMHFPAQVYLVNFALPNLYFHSAMAYGIARKNGVPLGKPNFMGRE